MSDGVMEDDAILVEPRKAVTPFGGGGELAMMADFIVAADETGGMAAFAAKRPPVWQGR